MAVGTIIRAWQDQTAAHLAVLVDEGGSQGKVEYVGSVPLTDLAGLSNVQIKAVLVAAVKAVRDQQQTAQAVIAGVSGGVTL